MSRLLAPGMAATISFSFSWIASESLFWARWIRKTIRKVTTVVPVLITSCHVSEKRKIGPVTSQTMMMLTAIANAQELPVQAVTARDQVSSFLPTRDRGGRGCGCERMRHDTLLPRDGRAAAGFLLGLPARGGR